MSHKRCTVYVVDLGDDEVYVGATRETPAQRYRKHKAGGPTSVRIVRERGKRLRPDLAKRSEEETIRALRKAGYKVRGNPKPFRIKR